MLQLLYKQIKSDKADKIRTTQQNMSTGEVNED